MKRALAAIGHTFHGSGDAEYTRGFLEWATTRRSFIGMFAFALGKSATDIAAHVIAWVSARSIRMGRTHVWSVPN